jgi:hypothetical protein
MAARDDFDDDAAILDPLDRFIAGVDREFFADRFLERDLSSVTYSAGHGMNDTAHAH